MKPLKKGSSQVPEIVAKDTVAEGIAIAKPVRGSQVVEAANASKGRFIVVEDSEIRESLKKISRRGFYIEPTSAATIAGVSKYMEDATPKEVIVSTFTSHGLKVADKMLEILHEN